MRKLTLLLLISCLFIVVVNSYAWEWTAQFSANYSVSDNVDDPGVVDDNSYSLIVNYGSDDATVRAIIWGNNWPEHYHEVVDPINGLGYASSQNQTANLVNHRAEIQVFDGVFSSSTDYIKVKMRYPN